MLDVPKLLLHSLQYTVNYSVPDGEPNGKDSVFTEPLSAPPISAPPVATLPVTKLNKTKSSSDTRLNKALSRSQQRLKITL